MRYMADSVPVDILNGIQWQNYTRNMNNYTVNCNLSNVGDSVNLLFTFSRWL